MIRALYLIYQIFIALPIMIVVTIIVALATMIGSIFNDRFWGYWPGMIWGRLFYLIFLIPLKVDGKEHIKKGQSYVIAPNHQSYWDAFLIYGYIGIKFKWMMKKELGKIPFVGWACYMAGCIFIDRSSRESGINSIRKAESKLKDGMSVVIFPEGTRSYDGQMGKFKRGAFLISEELQLPILPVTWHPVHMTIHEPVWPKSTKDMTETQVKEIMNETSEKVYNTIKETLDKGN